MIDVDLDKASVESEPNLEGRGGGYQDELITTTEAATSTEKSTPLHVDQCRLPYYPVEDSESENAWRFGRIFD